MCSKTPVAEKKLAPRERTITPATKGKGKTIPEKGKYGAKYHHSKNPARTQRMGVFWTSQNPTSREKRKGPSWGTTKKRCPHKERPVSTKEEIKSQGVSLGSFMKIVAGNSA